MKNSILLNPLKFVAAWLVVLFVVSGVLAQTPEPWSINRSPLPAPTGFVNDYAGVIDAATKQQIEAKLAELKRTTDPPVEIAVAVVRTTDGRDISEYSIAVARGWGIGSKEDDNPSALLFIAVDDRKYFTQISKDLEDELPDGLVGSLQRQYLVPEFRKGNYGKGIADTIDAYIARIRDKGNVGSNTNKPADSRSGEQAGLSGGVLTLFCCAGIIILILIIIFSNSRGGPTKRDRDRWGGGGFGGSGSGGMGGSALPWIVGGILGGGSGGSSGGSDWGGSSGGSDWGGFGGGGDFGGGGAGGDW